MLDVGVNAPRNDPGTVQVAVLSREGNGAASPELVATVASKLSADDVRPLSDTVEVSSASIIEYQVTATLTFYNGPDIDVVTQAARAAMTAYAARQHRMGRDITLSGVYAALHQEGVEKVTLTAPAADIAVAWNQAAYCTLITLHNGGVDG